MKPFRGSFIATAMLAALAATKEVTNVFRTIDYVSADEYPFWFTHIGIGWVLDSAQVQTGDTFSLVMPDTFMAMSSETDFLLPFFNMLAADGTPVASCDIYNAVGISSSTATNITCVVTADFCKQPVYENTEDLSVVFDAGGRVETVDNAIFWTTNTNVITYNGNLSFAVTFNPTSPYTLENLWYLNGMNPDTDFSYWLAPEYCDFTSYTAVVTATGNRVLEPATLEAYGATSLNPYGFPVDVVSIPVSTTISPDLKTMTLSFDSVPSDVRVWFSFYSQNTLYSETDYMIFEDTFHCPDGSSTNRSETYQMNELLTVQGE
jgi:hypothetical protein